jgi:hypothetical protein
MSPLSDQKAVAPNFFRPSAKILTNWQELKLKSGEVSLNASHSSQALAHPSPRGIAVRIQNTTTEIRCDKAPRPRPGQRLAPMRELAPTRPMNSDQAVSRERPLDQLAMSFWSVPIFGPPRSNWFRPFIDGVCCLLGLVLADLWAATLAFRYDCWRYVHDLRF